MKTPSRRTQSHLIKQSRPSCCLLEWKTTYSQRRRHKQSHGSRRWRRGAGDEERHLLQHGQLQTYFRVGLFKHRLCLWFFTICILFCRSDADNALVSLCCGSCVWGRWTWLLLFTSTRIGRGVCSAKGNKVVIMRLICNVLYISEKQKNFKVLQAK